MKNQKIKTQDAKFTKKWAKHWSVTPRSINRWLKEGAPVDNPVEMEKWLRTRKTVPAGAQKKLKKLRSGASGPDLASAFEKDPDWVDYQQFKADCVAAGRELKPFELEDYRNLYAFKLERANERGDERNAKFFGDQLIAFDKAIRENKLMADRLGIDEGTTLQRAEVERWFRAFGFWTMRGVDLMLDAMIPRITALSPTLTYEIVRKAIEPAIIEERFFRPYVQATRVASASALPDWAVACIRDTVDDYIEKGAESFDEDFGVPVAATRGRATAA